MTPCRRFYPHLSPGEGQFVALLQKAEDGTRAVPRDALGGAPGVYSARFSGGDDEDNNALLLEKLSDKADKRAHYTCAMALCSPMGELTLAEGYMYGHITSDRRGTRGFGYDPLFIPVGETRTVAQMTDEEKNAISHRGNALKLLLEKLG